MKKYLAEMIGTMVLVVMGCGSAIFAGNAADVVGQGVGTLGVAMAFGLAVVAMAYTIGGVSGCHINPAITLGVLLSGRMKGKDAALYMLFQVVGAIVGSALLYLLVSNGAHNGPTQTGSNSFAEGSMIQAFIAEALFTFIFVLVVLGTTDEKQFGRISHWFGFGFDSYRMHSYHRNLCQSCTQHRSGIIRWRFGTFTTLALYRSPIRRSHL